MFFGEMAKSRKRMERAKRLRTAAANKFASLNPARIDGHDDASHEDDGAGAARASGTEGQHPHCTERSGSIGPSAAIFSESMAFPGALRI